MSDRSGPLKHLQILHTVAGTVSRSLDVDEVLRIALDALTDVTGHEISSLHLLSEDGATLRLRGRPRPVGAAARGQPGADRGAGAHRYRRRHRADAQHARRHRGAQPAAGGPGHRAGGGHAGVPVRAHQQPGAATGHPVARPPERRALRGARRGAGRGDRRPDRDRARQRPPVLGDAPADRGAAAHAGPARPRREAVGGGRARVRRGPRDQQPAHDRPRPGAPAARPPGRHAPRAQPADDHRGGGRARRPHRAEPLAVLSPLSARAAAVPAERPGPAGARAEGLPARPGQHRGDHRARAGARPPSPTRTSCSRSSSTWCRMRTRR